MATPVEREEETREADETVEVTADMSDEQRELFRSLQRGVSVTKFGRRGNPQTREFKLTDDMHLTWRSRWKSAAKTQVDLSGVSRVQSGQQTQKFARHKNKFRDAADASFSIIYDGQLSSLDLVCDTPEEQKLWVSTLEALVRHSHKGKQLLDPETAYYKRQWKKADADGSGTLDTNEVIQLVQKLNINVDRKYIKAKIKQVDVNEDKELQFDEFVELMRLLRARDEVECVYLSLLQRAAAATRVDGKQGGGSGGGATSANLKFQKPSEADKERIRNEHLPWEVFQAFLTDEQGEAAPTDQEVQKLCLTLDPEGEGKVLCYRAFYAYMSGAENEAFQPLKANSIYQDMTHPLSHYFIASSHNTYLEGDQLQSSSSVNRYINDLCKGCRCVEIDCWDGEDGNPVVFHGHTLTGKVRFYDVIDAIKQYSFLNSPYPVILSLENHCSIPQQEKMASYMKEKLGDAIAVPPPDMEVLPTPESLLGKILLKGKIVRDENQVVEEDESDEEAAEELEEAGVTDLADADVVLEAEKRRESAAAEAAAAQIASEAAAAAAGDNGASAPSCVAAVDGAATNAPSPAPTAGDGSVGSTKQHARSGRGSRGSGSSFSIGKPRSLIGAGGGGGGGGKKAGKHKVAMELSRITFLGGAKFKGWEAAKQAPVNAMSSFSETKTGKLLAKQQAMNWVMYNQRQMSRIYPAGARVDSSNYDPQPSWNVGSQIVALNYQTSSLSMRLNDGKFRDNGGCGYVLKPPALRDPDTTYSPDAPSNEFMTLTVRVISAQQLPKPGGAERGEIIDPYVLVSISGLPADTTKRPFRTKTIDDNGFNPIWDESFELKYTASVEASELGLLNLTVMDEDVDADDFVAYAVIPLHGLRTGYRSVALFSGNGTRHGEFEHSSLFCHFSLR